MQEKNVEQTFTLRPTAIRILNTVDKVITDL